MQALLSVTGRTFNSRPARSLKDQLSQRSLLDVIVSHLVELSLAQTPSEMNVDSSPKG